MGDMCFTEDTATAKALTEDERGRGFWCSEVLTDENGRIVTDENGNAIEIS